MSQAEYKRPHNTGRFKIVVVGLLVLVLCLACFGIGVMVGGSGSEQHAGQTAVQGAVSKDSVEEVRSVPAPPRGEKAAVPKADQLRDLDSAQTLSVEQEAPEDMERQDEASVRIEETVVREIPLGSGINPRKKAPETTVATQKVEEQAGTDSQATSSAPETSAAKGGTELNKNSSSSSVAASEGGAYVVQVASFRDGADARALAQKVQPEFPAYVREADLGEKGKWSRVLVGPFVEREEADKVRSRLKESAKLDGFVKKAP